MSEQQSEATALAWGDIVRIHGVNLKKQKGSQGLIISKGFTDRNLYYQKYEDLKDVNFFRESLFQILPRSNFDMNDKLLEETDKKKIQSCKKKAQIQVENLYKVLDSTVDDAKQQKSQKGAQQNQEIMKKGLVLYGNQVIFKHMESNAFLKGIVQAAESGGDGAFKVQLGDNPCSMSMFQVKSHRTYIKDGDIVYYDDELQLFHPGSDCYTNFSEKADPIYLDDNSKQVIQPEKDHPSFKYFAQRPASKRPKDIRINIINENKHKCLWKFIRHCDYDQSKSKELIKSHDIVYFKHTSNNGLVASSLAYQSYFLKQFDEYCESFDCYWELIPKEGSKSNRFWARSIVTGKMLKFKDFDVQIEPDEKGEEGSTKAGFENQSLVKLRCNQDDSLMDRGDAFGNRQDIEPIIQQHESKIHKFEFKAVTQLGEDSFSINRVDENTMMDIGFVISSHQPIVKFLEIISSGLLEHEKQDDPKYARFFKQWLKNEDILSNMCKILTALSGRIYGTQYEDIESSGNTPISQVQKILVQTGVAELTIQIIYHLFKPYVFIESDSEPSDDRPIRNKIIEIFQYSYRLLEKIAAGNMQNRIYMSRWVNLFLQHSNSINQSYIQDCLVGILQNNPKSIELTINEQIITNLIEACFSEINRIKGGQYLTTKYLKLFSTFIKCEDRVLKQNQSIILNKFFKNNHNKMSFQFKIENKADMEQDTYGNDFTAKLKTKQIVMHFGNQEFCTIRKFYKDWKSRWNYFMAYVSLLADICMDRNSQAIENVSALLSLRIIVIILLDSEIDQLNADIMNDQMEGIKKGQGKKYPILNIREPFLRVAHYVYINNDKFTKIKRIKKISNWYKYENREGVIIEEINKTKRPFEGQKEEEEKKYLAEILEFIKWYLSKCDQNPHNLTMLFTVLNTLEETILLGLWEHIQSFRDMIPDIIMRITKIQSSFIFSPEKDIALPKQLVEFNKKKLKMNKPQINQLIDCKVKATKIFDLISEMEIDIRLRYMMNFFKGLYQATQKFSVYNIEDENPVTSEEQDVLIRNSLAKAAYQSVDASSLLGQIKKISEDQEIMMKQTIWYNKLKEMTPFEYIQTDDPVKNRYLFESVVKSNSYKFEDIVLSLFELSSYGNCSLLKNTLSMINNMFEQRRALIENMKAILICGKGNLFQVYRTLKFTRAKFDILGNTEILKQDQSKLLYKFWKPYDHEVKAQAQRSGIIQDLFFLSRTLKQNISLKNIDALMYVDEALFEQGNFDYLNERQKNNQLFQSVNLAEGIYLPLIQFIKLVGNNPILKIHRKILISIYQYLTLLCFNNLEVKQVLMKYIPVVLPHLQRKVGASNFIYEVSVNNKLLVNDQEMVDMIINASLEACLTLSNQDIVKTTFYGKQLGNDNQNDYEKSKILFSLRGILIFNEQGIKKNQDKLMNKIQDNKYRMLIFTGSTPFVQKLDNLNLSPKEFYVSTVFELFSVLVESKNFINIGKLENVYKHSYLLQCLKQTNRWQIRRSIRSFMNRLYYVNKDKDIFMFEEFIRQEFSIINKQFYDLIQLHKSKMLTDQLRLQKGIRFKFAKSQIFLMILQLLITLHQMLLKPDFIQMIKVSLNKEKTSNDKKVHDHLIRLLRNLGCINKLYPRTKPIAPFVRQIRKLLAIPFTDISVAYLEKRSEPQSNVETSEMDDLVQISSGKYIYDHSKTFFRNLHDMIRQLKAKQKMQKIRQQYMKSKQQGFQVPDDRKRQKYMDIIFSVPGEPSLKPVDQKAKDIPKTLKYNPGIQTANSKIFKVLAKPELGENQQNFQLNRKLSIVKQMIDDMAVFRKFEDDQFIKLVSIFEGLDQTSKNFYSLDWQRENEQAIAVFSMNQMIRTTFSLIINNPEKFGDKEKIFIIKLIRSYITESIQKQQDYKLPIDRWGQYQDGQGFVNKQSKQEISQLKEFKARQNRVMECGGSAFIIEIFKQNFTGNRLELLNQALLFGISYLYRGNTDCQNSILQELKKDPQNKMLLNINKIIWTIGQFLINIRKIKEGQKKRNFAYQIVDTYDFYSVQEKNLNKQFGHSTTDKFEAITEMNFENALCRTFRFLQLFCQNNNVGMKDFILEQTNEDGQKKDSSIDFILTTTNLLRSIFKSMNNKLVSIPKSLLDFLTETTQTPCIKNQIALLKSTFYEDVSYMSEFFYKQKQNLLNRKFNKIPLQDGDPHSKLIEIYEMSMNLILINFEGNDDLLVWELLSKCQPVFFWQIIRQNLLTLLIGRAQDYGIQPEDEGEDNAILADKLFKAFDRTRIEKLIEQQQENQKNFEGPMDVVIRTLCIFKKLNDFADKKKEIIDKDFENADKQDIEKQRFTREFKNSFVQIAKKEFPAIVQFLELFQKLILQIEVFQFNGKQQALQKIYFVNQPVFQQLSKQTQDSIMMNVKRQTQRDKLRTLLDYRQQVNNQIDNNYDLNYNKFVFRTTEHKVPITAQIAERVRVVARNTSSAIVLMMALFIFVDHDLEDQSSVFTYNNWFQKLLIKTMCIFQLLMTFLYCYLWLRLRKPLALNKLAKDEKESSVEQKQAQNDELTPPQPTEGWGQIAIIIQAYWRSITENLQFISNFYYSSFPYEWFIRPFYALCKYQSSEFLPIIVFVLAALAGNIYGVQWYTIHIFDYFATIPIMANVFKAIFNNVGVLTLLSCVAGCFILVFNVVSLSTYSHVIWSQDIPEEACEQILGCVLDVYTEGAVGGDMQEFEFGRFCFDIGYLVFMEMLFGNIVGGIIMDTYSALGENDNTIQEDKDNKCYICGMDKPNMQKIGETFKKHTRGRHYLWNYIYYVYTLEKKSATDYSGIEYKIKEKIDNEDVTWFPSLGEGDNDPEIEDIMNGLQENIDVMNEKAKSVIEKNNQLMQTAQSTTKIVGEYNKRIKANEIAVA